MARSNKSQWDFGELFPSSEGRQVLTVAALTGQVRKLIEAKFATLWIKGEVSNFRMQASGHAYFILKDAEAQLPCVLFRGQEEVDRSILREGASVIVGGDLTVYEARGQYQLRVTHVEAQGIGALQLAFERLKQKLSAEGLFDQARKRPLPAFPKRIALVTSPTGAALQDMLHVIGRRYCGLEIVLVPCRVQGVGAAQEIAEGIELANRWHSSHPERGIDLIIVGRGGGSVEDLWCFNEEIVARALANSALPTISAVGHEIDFTISDFVADLRAATPSAAAEIVTQQYVASREFIERAAQRLANLTLQAFTAKVVTTQAALRRLQRVHPRRQIEFRAQALDEASEALRRSGMLALRERSQALALVIHRLQGVQPSHALELSRHRFHAIQRRFVETGRERLRTQARRLDRTLSRLQLLSPLNVLERGYSITLDGQTGAVIRDASGFQSGQRLVTRLHKGELGSVVTRVTKEVPLEPPS
ncbi:MAG TPA: exodeoxyribonuclease VII large subunit [Candidatus Limnocylindria bacterium]|nr:exodeoxyribonuclease VII large subunit [Candidatus Limnocylindria bacterium]